MQPTPLQRSHYVSPADHAATLRREAQWLAHADLVRGAYYHRIPAGECTHVAGEMSLCEAVFRARQRSARAQVGETA